MSGRLPQGGYFKVDDSLTAPRFVPAGKIFTSNGAPMRYRGVTAFPFFDRVAKGQDVRGWLQPFRELQFNVIRVFLYVPTADWGASAWGWPETWTVIEDGISTANSEGFAVEIVTLTDDDSDKIPLASSLFEWLSERTHLSVLVELGNEPRTHKNINVEALRGMAYLTSAASGIPYSSGIYENSSEFFGTYGTAHTPRDSEWPRKAHDLLEYYNGGGPNAPSDPAHKCPWVADEPIRPDQVGYNEQDFLAYFAASSLLGAGATFHFDAGKLMTTPTADEMRCARAASQGLLAFPADAPLGSYARPNEGTATLRTYKVGPYTVRVRPTDGRVIV